jgi:hypothetical protein
MVAPLPARASVRLDAPVTVELDGDDDSGSARLVLPFESFEPLFFAEQAATVTEARLLAPWAGRHAGVRFEQLPGGIVLTAESVRPRAWAYAPACFELVSNDGRRMVLEVAVPEVTCDFSARERAMTRDAMFESRRALHDSKVAQAEADAAVADPEHRIAVSERTALSEAREALAGVLSSLAVRRAEVRAEMATAKAAVWALAAEFPDAIPGSAAAEISKLSSPLLSLANQQSFARERVESLRKRVGRLMNDTTLSEAVRAEAARESRAALSDKELTLAVLNAEVAELIADIQRRASEAGLEDELLARGDFLLGGYPQGGLEGSFRHLLNSHARLLAEVEKREQICVAHSTLGLLEARQRAADAARKAAELEQRLNTLTSQLNWLDRAKVLHPVATRYRG